MEGCFHGDQNDEFNLGRTGEEASPGEVIFKEKITGISAGDSHSVAYSSETGNIYSWGLYWSVQGPINARVESPTPVLRSTYEGEKVIKVASGANHTLVLTNKWVYGMGDPESGWLGEICSLGIKYDQDLN